MGLTSESVVKRRMKAAPVVYAIFDVLYLNGHSTMSLPYRQRRQLLTDLRLEGPAWRVPGYHEGDGRALLEATKAQGIEGLVAKELESRYEPGRRTRTWLKVKNTLRQEFVIAGYTPGEGTRATTIGALLIGYYEGDALHYAGKVGTGLTEDFMRQLLPVLEGNARAQSPFVDGKLPKGSRYIEPVLVGEVEFTEWTSGGMIRHPSFKGLRSEKDPKSIGREIPAEAP
jgi:bifunctional non-homologous end joining protein LigD